MLHSGISKEISVLQPDIFEKSVSRAQGLAFGGIVLDVSDVGASPCQVMAEGTWATRLPFLRLRGVDGGRENGGRAVQRGTGGRNSSHRSGREGEDGGRVGTNDSALGIIQSSEPG